MKQLSEQYSEQQNKPVNEFSASVEKNFLLTAILRKREMFIFVLSCSAICSFGQSYIEGRIKDQQQNIASATVLLLGSDSSLIKQVVTDNKGEFIFDNVKPGYYMISSSMVGYYKFL